MNTKQTSENILLYCTLNNEDQLKNSGGWGENISRKTTQGQDGKEFFRKTKKVFIKI